MSRNLGDFGRWGGRRVWGKVATLFAAVGMAASLAGAEIRFRPGASGEVVAVSGLGAADREELARVAWSERQWQQVLAVYADQGDALQNAGLPAVRGKYSVEGGEVRFGPLFPFERGVMYRVVFRASALPRTGGGGQAPVVVRLMLSKEARAPSTRVEAVYPGVESVPENLLKFYLYFSAPMSRGHIYEHIRLLGEDGQPVELPFLEIDEELWDRDRKRLTLFLDPGRIKRGVKPLEEIGPSLRVGRGYRLVIERTWLDGEGIPLAARYEKRFRVGPADRTPVDLATWEVGKPRVGTREPLVVRFGEPLDRALVERMIRVWRGGSEELKGRVEVRAGETEWRWTPEEAWREGAHELRVDNTIEDLAGNNIGKPFDVDLFETVQAKVVSEESRLGFQVLK